MAKSLNSGRWADFQPVPLKTGFRNHEPTVITQTHEPHALKTFQTGLVT